MSKAGFEVTTENFEREVLNSALPVLVDFGAAWCPPCRMLDPIVDALAAQYADSLRVGRVDCDAEQELVIRYRVSGMPTLLLFQNGEAVRRIVGFQTREKIEAQILPYLHREQA